MKPEVWNIRERFTAAALTDRVLLGFVYHVQINKTRTTILKCATEDFSEISKM